MLMGIGRLKALSLSLKLSLINEDINKTKIINFKFDFRRCVNWVI